MKSSDQGYPNRAIYRQPTADEIKRLQASHGWTACRERWWYVGDRQLALIRQKSKHQAA